jgi:hypothetical protein
MWYELHILRLKYHAKYNFIMNLYKTPIFRLLHLNVEKGFGNSEQDGDLKYENGGEAWDE